MRLFTLFLLTIPCFGASLSTVSAPPVLAFEARDGQYVSHGPGYALSVTPSGAVLSLNGQAVRMSIADANPDAVLEALDRMPGRANYLLGRDLQASYDLFGRIRRRGVYPGIDMVFRGNQQHLEYDFEIAAGRDPRTIQLDFGGVDEMRIERTGELILRVGTIQIRQPKPVAYQMVAGSRQPVDTSYWIDSSNHVRFRPGGYDRHRPLVIDPQIVFDQSFGGSGTTTAMGLARDSQGGLYVAGTTNAADFVTVNPLQSHLATAPLLVTANSGQTWSFPSLGAVRFVGAIAAAPSSPSEVYAATPLGVWASSDGGTTWAQPANSGTVGPVTAVAVDAGAATTLYAGTAQGVFVSTDGGANWRKPASFFVGTGIGAIAAHPTEAGTVFVSVQNPPSLFRSTDFGQNWTEMTAAPPNEKVSAVNALAFGSNGTMIAATVQRLLISTDGGSTWTAGANLGVSYNQELAVAPNDPATVYAVTQSGVQRSLDGGQTFTVVLPSVTSAYLGTVAIDPRAPATVYAAANVYPPSSNVLYRSTDAGQTWTPLSLPYPVNPQALFVSPVDSRVFLGAGTGNNVFVTKWSADGSKVLYSTYLGGSQKDGVSGIAVDGSGSAYLTGLTSSPDFPTTGGAFQTKLTTTQDAYVAKLSPDGSRLSYSTLLGADLQEYTCCQPTQPTGIAVDGRGEAVITGFTEGAYPVTPNAFQSAPVAGCNLSATPSSPTAGEAFVTRIAAGGSALVYSTLLGGSCATFGVNVALDANGNAWVAGATQSPDFPVTKDALQAKYGGGMFDGFLARFSPSGSLDYATYVGGPGYDTLNAIAFDGPGNIYLTGESGGLSQAAPAGAFQPKANATCLIFSIGPSFFYPQGNAVVLRLDAAAHSIQRLTYLGAPLCLSGSSIAVDSSGEPWIGGTVDPIAGAPPTVNPLEIGTGRGFLSKLSADFTQLLFSTYFDSVAGLALDPGGLAYVAGSGIADTTAGTQSAYVAKIDAAPLPDIAVDSVTSAVPVAPASFPGIAAGEVVRIVGRKMGPAAATPGVIQAGMLAATVAGVQVTFDGVAVPLLSVSAQEIELVAPFALAGKTATTIQVLYNGARSNAVQVAVTGTVLQVLGVYNGDFSVNSVSNPAKAGSVMSLYLAGVGQSDPPSQDGQINTAPLPVLGRNIQIAWFGNSLNEVPVTFAGAASNLAAGIFQINFVAPPQSVANMSLSTGNTGLAFSVWVQ